MSSWRKALFLGFLVWLVPFMVAFGIFFLRESSRPLFESIMAVTVTTTVVLLGLRYLRTVRENLTREGILVGILWFCMSVVIDSPLMLLGGPMQMSFGEYMADIGVTYLIIPVVT